jgi:hypothetical protein
VEHVEHVATWVGLITGVIGVTLSLLAGWFAFEVNKRADTINNQVITTLQKIESAVERTSTDTQGLIKVAWHRLVVNGEHTGHELPDDSEEKTEARSMTSGLAAEAVAEMAGRSNGGANGNGSGGLASLEQRFEELLSFAEIRGGVNHGDQPSSTALAELGRRIEDASPLAVEVVRALSEAGAPLQRQQYADLVAIATFGEALTELRRCGILAPLSSSGERYSYYFPPGVDTLVPHAVTLFAGEFPTERALVASAFTHVGYHRPQAG